MLKRIENSSCCSQMTSPPLLKPAFQPSTIIDNCNCRLAKRIVRLPKTCKNHRSLVQPTLRGPLQGAIDGSDSPHKNFPIFSFLQ